MEDCIQKLTDHQKTAVELFYLKGKCYKEVAQITNLEVNMVKSQIQNGRRNLKICMESNQHQIN
jgi:RNA polymerase sigma-70 factor (ECF subfamily)